MLETVFEQCAEVRVSGGKQAAKRERVRLFEVIRPRSGTRRVLRHLASCFPSRIAVDDLIAMDAAGSGCVSGSDRAP